MKTYFIIGSLLLNVGLFSQCDVAIIDEAQDCDSLCEGSLTAMASGISPFTYSWSNGDTTSTADSLCAAHQYTVTIIDSMGCTASTASTLFPTMKIDLVLIASASCANCCDGIIWANTWDYSCPPYTYSWLPSGPFWNDTNATTCVATYTCCIYNACGCVRCDTLTVPFSTGFTHADPAGEITISPNPIFDAATLNLPKNFGEGSLRIYSPLGVLLREEKIEAPSGQIDRKYLPAGTYFYEVESEIYYFQGSFIIAD
jgi:hypothetical protein